ncbi:polyribonucleotide nucleotidyltransferase [Bradyrhizobium elkanii]
MFNTHSVEIDWGGRPLKLETGKIARQADGAVLATYGETVVLATVVAAKAPREGVDFLPLTVDYQEKTYAAGRIPGGYFKREGRPTEKETLVSRLIDRPIRPLFVDGWRNETQVIVTVLSHDMENDPDIVSLVAASAALTLSGAPFKGPIGAARVGFANDEYVLNPTLDEMTETQLDLVVAGTADAVLMVESEAKELNEDVMLGAVMFGHRHFQPVINAIIELAEKAAKEPREVTTIDNSEIEKEMLGIAEQELRNAYAIPVKQERYAAVGAVKEKVLAHFFPEGQEPKYDKLRVAGVFKELEAKIVRWNILDTGKRIDGRDAKTVRNIIAEAGVLPRAHGSALFTRGETQAMVVTTLGDRRGRAVHRCTVGDLQGNVPAALQLPALLGRRDRSPRRHQAPRDRPWQARLARDPPGAAAAPRVPVHDPRGLRDHRVERLVLDGLGVRRLAVADGRRRAAEAADRRYRHGPDPRRSALCGAVGHPR